MVLRGPLAEGKSVGEHAVAMAVMNPVPLTIVGNWCTLFSMSMRTRTLP